MFFKDAETLEDSSKNFEDKKNQSKEVGKLDEETIDKTHNNIVTSLAEKAMSVAAPVVPMKEDGAVDHERSYNLHIMLFFFFYFKLSSKSTCYPLFLK